MSDPFAPDSGWGNYALAGFTEIELPTAIALIPQTPGWWLLLFVILYFLGKQSYRAIRRYWRNRYRRLAIQQLQSVQNQINQGDSTSLSKIPAILKATALHAYPRQNVAKLFGREWEAFLDNSYDGPSFTQHFPGKLYALSYQTVTEPLPKTSELNQQFWQQCHLWISTHRSDYD